MDRNQGYPGDFIQFSVIECDSDDARYLWNTYEWARPWRCRMLGDVGSYVGVKNGVDMLKEDWVQSTWVRLKIVVSTEGL